MTDNEDLARWVDRAQRMAEYRAEASDFVRRAAAAMLPAVESDVELVCRLWVAADERDVLICEALTKFDEALFDTPGDLEITRGAEPRPSPDDEDRLLYVCSWTLRREDGRAVSVALAADRLTGAMTFEVLDPVGMATSVPSPEDFGANELYEALSLAFFTMRGLSQVGIIA